MFKTVKINSIYIYLSKLFILIIHDSSFNLNIKTSIEEVSPQSNSFVIIINSMADRTYRIGHEREKVCFDWNIGIGFETSRGGCFLA